MFKLIIGVDKKENAHNIHTRIRAKKRISVAKINMTWLSTAIFLIFSGGWGVGCTQMWLWVQILFRSCYDREGESKDRKHSVTYFTNIYKM